MPAATDVLKVAVKQIGICEKPAGSNKVKYNTWFYGYPVSGQKYAWCATFLDWCFEKAGCGKLYPHNANAADAQDDIVYKCGGSWIMRKNGSSATRKEYLKKAKPGDIVCFDFGIMDAYRWHTGIVEKVSGNYLICIEGNTSKTGSQSNGGMVVRQRRLYTSVCSAARPKFDGSETPEPKPVKPTVLPALPKRGWFHKGDKGPEVLKMQNILVYLGFDCGIYGADGVLGAETQESIERFEKKYGLTQDGEWGKLCNEKAAVLLGIKTHVQSKTTQQKMVEWAESIEKKGTFKYKKWDAHNKQTQICPICNNQTGKYHGWNCIGYVSAICHHGGGLNTKCSCNGLGDDNFFTNVTGESWRKRNGKNWDMISNNGKKNGASIPASKLKAGDVLICYDDKGKFHHMAFYKGNGKYSDDTSGRTKGVGEGDYSGICKRMHVSRAFRYKG